MSSDRLAKAKLFSIDAEKYDIEFMYNPSQLEFSRGIKLNQPAGARDKKGQTKVSFANPEPCALTISKILFDTYEEGTDVFKKCILPLIQAVKFLDSGSQGGSNTAARSRIGVPALRRNQNNQNSQNQRPPIYYFVWGSQNYLRCFVESFKYQITMFLPDGTPVRATASLSLKEVDGSTSSPDQRVPSPPARNDDTRENRLAGR